MKTTKKIAKKILIAHIYLAVVVLTGQVFAQTGAWTPTGSMTVQRRDHTATLLTNGKVLINRGTGGSAELYDPVTGTFSPTGPSLGGGFAPGSTATRLQDGRVLIVGGSPAEIDNPPTGTFSPAGNLNVARVAHTATLLRDGKVLIAGGSDIAGGQHLAVVELYDPVTGTFTLTGHLNAGRFSHSATLLQDGRVLIAGGEQITSPGFAISLSSAELYDPATGAFSPTGNLTQPRGGLSFTQAPLLNNGKVLIVGGETIQAAEIFDPATGTFSRTGNMSIARSALSATVLSSGQVLVAGGVITLPGGGPGTTNLVEIYDPVSGAFRPAAFMIQARQQHTATLLPNGQVLVTGGFDFGAGSDLSSAELFSAPTNTPPAITAASVSRTQGLPGSIGAVAQVNDAEDALNTLNITVNGAASATAGGVTVSSISVNASGQVTASVGADCNASNASFTLRVSDGGGLFAEATLNVTVTTETIPPVIACPVNVVMTLPPNTMDTGMVVNYPAPTATDNCTASPTITTSQASGTVFPLGLTTVIVTATDAANNQATCSFTVTVRYNFSGFFHPVDNPPTVNAVNAGRAIPLKFSLSGDKGLNIFGPGYPASQQIACDDGAPASEIEQTVTAGGSSLSYDAASDQYSYVWKTEKSWAGTCRQLILRLNDGSERVAFFKFK